MSALYCKCGNPIIPSKWQKTTHRGDDVCEECRRAGIGPRYSKYLDAAVKGQRKGKE